MCDCVFVFLHQSVFLIIYNRAMTLKPGRSGLEGQERISDFDLVGVTQDAVFLWKTCFYLYKIYFVLEFEVSEAEHTQKTNTRKASSTVTTAYIRFLVLVQITFVCHV